MTYGTVQLSCTRAEMLPFACANPTLTRESFLVGVGVVVPPPPRSSPCRPRWSARGTAATFPSSFDFSKEKEKLLEGA